MTEFFKGWLPEMIGYAELIADKTALQKAWLERDFSQTSVINPGELFSQLFDGPPVAEIRQDLDKHLSAYPALGDALHSFLDALLGLQDWLTSQKPRPANASVLASDHWQMVRDEARAVLKFSKSAGFNSKDFGPTK